MCGNEHRDGTIRERIRPGREGAALVVVLALVALLAVVIVALMARAQQGVKAADSEVGIFQAEELVHGAMEITLSDLRLELQDGAESPTGGGPDSGERFWMNVEERAAMVPTRVLKDPALKTNSNFAALVKQSASGRGISTFEDGESGMLRRTSTVSTMEPAVNGRLVSPGRWGSVELAATALAPGQVPDWIYVSRDGSNPTTFSDPLKRDMITAGGGGGAGEKARNPEYVVGRYAYQIYETGGLLDISVAGYGEGADDQFIGTKGPLVWADLQSLPGMAGADLQGLAEWRNRLTEDWGPAGAEELTAWGNGSGWLGVRQDDGASDNQILGRQDLIRLSRQRPEILPRSALPRLTHFTRELNAPSGRPRKNADGWGGSGGSEWAYKDNYPEGAPVLGKRFALSAIDLFAALKADPGSSDIEEQIAEKFGLERVGGSNHIWRYTAYVDDGGAEAIADVADAVDAERGANFFEVLREGILDGSLGSYDAELDWFYAEDDYDMSTTRQILRVGACLIDQWDRDDDPTIILAPEDGSLFNWSDNVEIAGVENLPYVDIIGQEHIVRWELPGYPDWPYVSGYYKIQLWNPHRNAADAEGGEFRVVLEGEPRVRLGISPEKNWYTNPRPIYWVESPGEPSTAETNFLEFSYPLPAAPSPYCERPVQLMGSMVAAGSEDNLLPRGSSTPKFAGLLLGTADTSQAEGMPQGAYPSWGHGQGHIRFNQPATVRLQKKIDGEWLTYQTVPRIRLHHGNIPWIGFRAGRGPIENNAENGTPSLRISYGRGDPRTLRFGMGSVGGGGSPHAADNTVYNPFAGGGGYAFAVPNHGVAPGGGEKNPIGYWWQLAQNSKVNVKHFVRRDEVFTGGDFTDESTYLVGGAASDNAGRPLILNRPFRSVAEMGFAFRDEPFKTLDFASPQSADFRLLDLFSLGGSAVRGGTFNINTVGIDVLAAVLTGAARDLSAGGNVLSAGEARSLADRFVAMRNRIGPLRDIGELGDYLAATRPRGAVWAVPGARVAEQDEAFVRAVADAGTTRNWNFLIDVIAQSGRLTRAADGLEDFQVKGERRYWMHVAIDRFTGEVVDRQWELVDE